MKKSPSTSIRFSLGFIGVIFLSLTLFCWLKPDDTFSASERRVLASAPKATPSSVLSGSFMTDFESYSTDQFPLRDAFRGIKTGAERFLFAKSEVNDLYYQDGYLAATAHKLNLQNLLFAADKINFIYDTYLADTGSNVYLAVVPDKNHYLAETSGRLSMDYEELVQILTGQVRPMTYIDLFQDLSIENYYRTDTHWRQETLGAVADHLEEALSFVPAGENRFTEYNGQIVTLDTPFFGVYTGQYAFPVAPDSLSYLDNDMLRDCLVTSYDNDSSKEVSVYTLEKASGNDPYEIFLNGSDSLLVAENPNALTDRELILFRDSFGSSIAPLLLRDYRKITLVDIRYLPSAFLGSYLEFTGQDVLFLYSTLVLNQSRSFR